MDDCQARPVLFQKPKAPLGATKLKKSHDQQTAIKTYSAYLLHI